MLAIDAHSLTSLILKDFFGDGGERGELAHLGRNINFAMLIMQNLHTLLPAEARLQNFYSMLWCKVQEVSVRARGRGLGTTLGGGSALTGGAAGCRVQLFEGGCKCRVEKLLWF